ncbi:hypothetical protein ACHHYP_18017 [Achlya hypogyna]|uniref:Uncharacterized protein n=1 Tax=Achlya hypogyna TaxID=1202772 RepID=A0A1V9YX28_ACHHY|nr:hypothetical protein ACHHYP_18017 [Achlya hypogyna]
MAEEAPPSARVEPPPQGTFTVALSHVVLLDLPAAATDLAPAEGDVTPRPPPSLWCAVSILTGKDTNTTWWYPPIDEHKRKVATNVVQVAVPADAGESPSFDYLQASKGFALTEDGLVQQLAKSSVRVELFLGYTRERDADTLLGAADVAFLPSIFQGTPTTSTLQLPGATVECTLAFDITYVKYFQQCKLLAVSQLQVLQLPTEWRLTLKDGDDPVKLCEDNDKNATKCTVTLKFPVTASAAASETMFSVDGRLGYDSTKEPELAWHVRFPLDSPLVIPLDKDGTEALVDAIESGRLVTMTLTRSLGTDTWNATAQLPLDAFLTPGTATVNIVEPLKKGNAPARETLEEALAKAANNDEKKKAQAALNDFENLLARIAGHAAIYVSANTSVAMDVAMYPDALVPLPPVPLPPTKTIAEYITPREPLPAYPTHDAIATMRKEVRKIIAILMKEYDKLFSLPEESDEYALSKEDRRHKLLFHLNANGIYFEFKEKLKKALVFVIREKFPSIVAQFPSHAEPLGSLDDASRQAKTAFYAQLYAFLMEEVHVVMNHVFCSAADDESTMNLLEATAPVAPDTVRAQLASLARLAWESEVNGQLKKAVTCHLDRIALSDKHAAVLGGYNADVWLDLALFHLRTGAHNKGTCPEAHNRSIFVVAGDCLRDCIATDSAHVAAIQAFGALLCNHGDHDGADTVLKGGLALVQRAETPPHVRARGHALLAIYYTTSAMDPTGNLRLHELMQAVENAAFATPTAVCIDVAAYYQDLRLDALASVALDLGATLLKPKAVYTSRMWTSERFAACACLVDALEKDKTFADAWYLQGLVFSRQQRLTEAITSYRQALAHLAQLRPEYHLPLYLQLGALYMHQQQWGEAKSVYLLSVDEASNASSWLGVGVVCVRQEDYDGAEMALAEANILDHTNADVWGYLALVCLHGPVPRPQQAEQALEQALRHDLSNPTLLREISSGFVALDKLEMAEALLRRSLVLGDSSLTRKTLADVLAAQNCAETALVEYQKALSGCESMDERAGLLARCAALLDTLGRFEDAREYRAMAAHQEEGAKSEARLLQTEAPTTTDNNAVEVS